MTIREFTENNRENIIDDIKTLVGIRSVKGEPAAGAPFGEQVKMAQLAAMRMCEREGFEIIDADGMIATAHYGPKDKFIGVFSHMDIVPEGDGWDTPPFECAQRDGFLVGRGVGDDKGPFVMNLYAAKYLKENFTDLKYGVQLIIGVDEETGMSDAEYYVKNFPQPVFAYTPDSDFPVCHGEKGIFEGDLVSGDLGKSSILEMSGGVASNVVPDHAEALISLAEKDKLFEAAEGNSGVKLTGTDRGIKVEAFGVSAHAGTPFKGVNAVLVLLTFLAKAMVLNERESDAADFICSVARDIYGRSLGIDCDDGKFTPLTIIAGTIKKEGAVWSMNVNSRYPTAIAPDVIEKKIKTAAENAGFEIGKYKNMPPFYLEPDLPAVRTLCEIYNELTGNSAKPYVMSGGTYARKLKNAVAFGPDFPEKKYPEWVGTAHMKNEAINIEDTLLAVEIYANVLLRLQDEELEIQEGK